MVFSILNLSILVKDCEDLFFFYQEKFINNKCLTHGRKMFRLGSNRLPSACEADVITTTLRKRTLSFGWI